MYAMEFNMFLYQNRLIFQFCFLGMFSVLSVLINVHYYEEYLKCQTFFSLKYLVTVYREAGRTQVG